MTPPKQDKQRKQWLASLKDGDEVGVLTIRGVAHTLTIARLHRRTARKEYMVLDTGRRFTLATGKQPLCDCWLVPITDMMRKDLEAEQQTESARRWMCRTYFGRGLEPVVPNDKILACAAILWPGEFGGKS